MKNIGDIMAPTGTYTKDGEEKTRWSRCGVLLQRDDGMYRIKLDTVPIGGDGWLAVFEQKPSTADHGKKKDTPF